MILSQKDILAFLCLNRLKIEGRRRVVSQLAEGKAAHEIHEQMAAEAGFQEMFVSVEGKVFNPDQEMELCLKKGIHFLTLADATYPALLKEIPDPPLLLYQKGEILESDQNAFAIVGTRHPSFYGRTQAQRFARELSAKGLTIVSGLARGIDQIAHEAALQVPYGRTIAVMGCGLDVIYPKENTALFEKITGRGAVLSEYPLGTPPLPENFPRRNRILSGLSYGVFVVEAHSRSGSLITAHQALDQDREVFALPGPVDQLTSRGTHQLLKEGACLVEDPEDIFEALAMRLKIENGLKKTSPSPVETVTIQEELPAVSPAKKVELLNQPTTVPVRQSEESGLIVDILREEGPLTQEEILDFTGLESAQLPVLLLGLELTKKIRRGHDGKYALIS